MNLPKRPPPLDAERYPILKRLCGKPGELILDNASEFTGHGLEDAAKGGSFSVRFCSIEQPRYRAIGERGLGTAERKMLEHLPGQSMTIEYNRRTGHDGEDLACVTPDELERSRTRASRNTIPSRTRACRAGSRRWCSRSRPTSTAST